MEAFKERRKNLNSWIPGWIKDEMKKARKEMETWMRQNVWIQENEQALSVQHAFTYHLNLTNNEIIERITNPNKDERVDISTNFKCEPIELFDKIEQALLDSDNLDGILDWLADASDANEPWWYVTAPNPFESNGYYWSKEERSVKEIKETLNIIEIRLSKEKNGNAFYIATAFPTN